MGNCQEAGQQLQSVSFQPALILRTPAANHRPPSLFGKDQVGSAKSLSERSCEAALVRAIQWSVQFESGGREGTTCPELPAVSGQVLELCCGLLSVGWFDLHERADVTVLGGLVG